MIMQQPSTEELCNLLIQSLIAKDENLLQKVLDHDSDLVIKEVINRVPVNHVRRFVIELGNLLSTKLSANHLKWLQNLLALKYSVISTMPDGRSILIPLLTLLNNKSSPAYYNKVQGLRGKLILLKQLRETRFSEQAETVVRIPLEPEQPAQMEIDSETDTESEEDFGDDDKIDDKDLADENNQDGFARSEDVEEDSDQPDEDDDL